eukprot:78077_1
MDPMDSSMDNNDHIPSSKDESSRSTNNNMPIQRYSDDLELCTTVTLAKKEEELAAMQAKLDRAKKAQEESAKEVDKLNRRVAKAKNANDLKNKWQTRTNDWMLWANRRTI